MMNTENGEWCCPVALGGFLRILDDSGVSLRRMPYCSWRRYTASAMFLLFVCSSVETGDLSDQLVDVVLKILFFFLVCGRDHSVIAF